MQPRRISLPVAQDAFAVTPARRSCPRRRPTRRSPSPTSLRRFSCDDINRPKDSDFALPGGRERQRGIIRPLAGARGDRKVQSSKNVGMAPEIGPVPSSWRSARGGRQRRQRVIHPIRAQPRGPRPNHARIERSRFAPPGPVAVRQPDATTPPVRRRVFPPHPARFLHQFEQPRGNSHGPPATGRRAHAGPPGGGLGEPVEDVVLRARKDERAKPPPALPQKRLRRAPHGDHPCRVATRGRFPAPNPARPLIPRSSIDFTPFPHILRERAKAREIVLQPPRIVPQPFPLVQRAPDLVR